MVGQGILGTEGGGNLGMMSRKTQTRFKNEGAGDQDLLHSGTDGKERLLLSSESIMMMAI